MTTRKKSFTDMVSDGLNYLSKNTSISYFGDGSIAKALVEATALEISRLQNYVTTIAENSFLSTASGIYLDLFGEMLGVPRLTSRTATILAEDGAVRFYTTSGTLGSKLPHPTDRTKGLIPKGTKVLDSTGYLEFTVTRDTSFPVNSRSVFVSVIASEPGSSYNVGANQLINHNLADTSIKVTNDITINTGGDTESDTDYKYRLSKSMTTRFGSNRSAIQVAALTSPGISDVRIIEFARGAGTFDVLLIPRGNRITEEAKEDTLRAINEVAAFGVYPIVKEPEYLKVAISIQLIFQSNVSEERQQSIKSNSQSTILGYLASIPLGGELVVNQLRSSVLSISQDIKDINILEMCVNGKHRVIRNIQLKEDEIFIPDDEVADPIIVL